MDFCQTLSICLCCEDINLVLWHKEAQVLLCKSVSVPGKNGIALLALLGDGAAHLRTITLQ